MLAVVIITLSMAGLSTIVNPIQAETGTGADIFRIVMLFQMYKAVFY